MAKFRFTGALEEARRRNVFRDAGLYIVGAWVVLQVAEIAFPALDIPESSLRYVWAGVIIIFPLAVFFGWRYEIAAGRIRRTRLAGDEAGQPLRRVDHLILTALIGTVAVLTTGLLVEISASRTPVTAPRSLADVDPASIAVLPFVNMSPDRDNDYLAAGIAEELLNALAKVTPLRVTARTSSFAFKDQAVDIRTIAERLGVAHVLEGSVRASGDKLRITAQLINSSDGAHEWSETYDRELQDIFAIQDDITSEVVSALRLALLDETVERPDLTRSDNVEAYTEYLKGINLLNAPTTESFQRALAHMQEAITLDPEYAQAYSTLGLIYFHMGGYGVIRLAEAWAKAKDAAARALEFAPESPHALALLGAVELEDGNDDAGRPLLEQALEIDPNNVFALSYYGQWLNRQDRIAEAEDIFRRIVALDPLDDYNYVVLFTFLRIRKSIPEALEIIPKWRKAMPDSANLAYNAALLYESQGNYAEAVRAMLPVPAVDPHDPEGPGFIAQLYLRMDMPDEASQWSERAIEMNPEHPMSLIAPLLLNFHQQQNEEENVRLARELLDNGITGWKGAWLITVRVLVEHAAKSGQYQELLERLENLYPHLFDDPPHGLEEHWGATLWVGLALAQSGDVDRGGRLLRAVKKFDDALDPGPTLESVMIRLALGEKEAAISRARVAMKRLQTGEGAGNVDLTSLKHCVIFDPIRDEPEFVALLDLYDRHAAEQRQLLQAMDIH